MNPESCKLKRPSESVVFARLGARFNWASVSNWAQWEAGLGGLETLKIMTELTWLMKVRSSKR